jgi:hypothetical protein
MSRRAYVSPDGALTFVVAREAGDATLGFAGMQWHTHADVLASEYGVPQDEAVDRFIAALLQNKSVIAVSRVAGIVSDVWIVDDPLEPDPYQPEDEAIEFRFWDGTPFLPVSNVD